MTISPSAQRQTSARVKATTDTILDGDVAVDADSGGDFGLRLDDVLAVTVGDFVL